MARPRMHSAFVGVRSSCFVAAQRTPTGSPLLIACEHASAGGCVALHERRRVRPTAGLRVARSARRRAHRCGRPRALRHHVERSKCSFRRVRPCAARSARHDGVIPRRGRAVHTTHSQWWRRLGRDEAVDARRNGRSALSSTCQLARRACTPRRRARGRASRASCR